MEANWNDVRFDYDGALALARALWQLGDDLDETNTKRSGRATTALTQWRGAYRNDFDTRATNEANTASQLAQGLRGDATGWAQCWALAMTEQNNRLYAREVERVESDRSAWDSISGWFVGHDDLPSQPTPLSPPSPPGFAPTGGFVSY